MREGYTIRLADIPGQMTDVKMKHILAMEENTYSVGKPFGKTFEF
jgi:hypothetical protein